MEPPNHPLAHYRPFALTRFVGTGGLVLVPAAAILSAGSLLPFIDLSAVLLVFGMTGTGLAATQGLKGIAMAVKTWLVGGTDGQKELACATFMQSGGLFLASGVVGSLIGVLQLLSNMSDPTALGPAMAAALLAALYGLLGGMASFVAAAGVANTTTEPDKGALVAGGTGIVLAASAMVLGVPLAASIGVLLVSVF